MYQVITFIVILKIITRCINKSRQLLCYKFLAVLIFQIFVKYLENTWSWKILELKKSATVFNWIRFSNKRQNNSRKDAIFFFSRLRNNRKLSIDTTESEYPGDECTVGIENPVSKVRTASANLKKRTRRLKENDRGGLIDAVAQWTEFTFFDEPR